ncbi:MAG TPA: helix-turn-helix transcriptional regulator [Oligoflexus sp.]|uniref:AraC family transcriptional regulator n=1 Tax=Oligoflexus sp. TaxID=1971216 RepID=UPI002D804B06|nr:helix-turn-helix transcriptional regulator [Oligoflexus sp.]HET9238759.1 helix-turn-helix transcriptional regulator [Oligoflexus sp.]
MKTRAQGLNLHDMKAFGLLHSNVEMIRIDRLEERHQPKIPFPHKHSFFQIVIISEGQGWHEIDFTRHPVQAGTLFIIKPGQVHAWELSPDTAGYLVEFESQTLRKVQNLNDPLARLHALPDAMTPEPAQHDHVLRLCQDMLHEQQGKPSGWETILQLELLTLLSLFFRFSPSSLMLPDKDHTLQIFFSLVETHFTRHHNLEFYADKLSLTPKALTMRVTRALGIPPKKVIQDRCLLEAKRLLAYSTDANTAIARKIGFDDPNYFLRLFRSKTGMTPSEFRSQQLDKSHRA